MNIKALKESLNEAKEAKKAILNGAITEFRSLEDTENEELRQLDEKIVELQKEIEALTENIIKEYRLIDERIKTYEIIIRYCRRTKIM